jgi:hypothetical protein
MRQAVDILTVVWLFNNWLAACASTRVALIGVVVNFFNSGDSAPSSDRHLQASLCYIGWLQVVWDGSEREEASRLACWCCGYGAPNAPPSIPAIIWSIPAII